LAVVRGKAVDNATLAELAELRDSKALKIVPDTHLATFRRYLETPPLLQPAVLIIPYMLVTGHSSYTGSKPSIRIMQSP